MSAATRSAVFCACAALCAFSEPPHVPGAGEEGGPAGLELERGVRHRFQKPAVVRDHDARRVERRELALEPFEARHVEVVRGLVEQDQVGVARERPRQRGARDLAARKGGELPVEVVVVEAQAARDGACVVAPGVAAGVLEPPLRAGIGGECRPVVVAVRHRQLEALQLALRGEQVGRAREDVLAQGQLAVERGPLVVQRDARPLLDHELPAFDRGLAGEHAEQRRLAGAVRAGQREPVPALQLERDAVEEEAAREFLAQVGGDHDGHAPMVARPRSVTQRRSRPTVPGPVPRRGRGSPWR